MARRRLQTILATTVLATGMSTMPAWAGPSLTGTLEDTVTSTTEEVTDTLEDTAEDLTEQDPTGVTETVTDELEDATDEATGSDDPSDEPTTEETSEPEDESSGPLDVDLDVDVAPEDEDGSPQLEVDGGVTVGDQTLDVGSATDPIEDAVDPDPEPSPSTDGSSTSETSGDTGEGQDDMHDDTGGGFLPGGGVTAAGTGDPRPADAPSSGGTTVGESFAAFGALNRGTPWAAPSMTRGTTTTTSREVPTPEVAAPQGDGDAATLEAPAVAAGTSEETPATLASGLGTEGGATPLSAALKALAGLLVLGTGAAAKRTLDQA